MNTFITSHRKCASCSRWREENKTHSMPDIKKNDEDHLDSDYEVQCKSENWL